MVDIYYFLYKFGHRSHLQICEAISYMKQVIQP